MACVGPRLAQADCWIHCIAGHLESNTKLVRQGDHRALEHCAVGGFSIFVVSPHKHVKQSYSTADRVQGPRALRLNLTEPAEVTLKSVDLPSVCLQWPAMTKTHKQLDGHVMGLAV